MFPRMMERFDARGDRRRGIMRGGELSHSSLKKEEGNIGVLFHKTAWV